MFLSFFGCVNDWGKIIFMGETNEGAGQTLETPIEVCIELPQLVLKQFATIRWLDQLEGFTSIRVSGSRSLLKNVQTGCWFI